MVSELPEELLEFIIEQYRILIFTLPDPSISSPFLALLLASRTLHRLSVPASLHTVSLRTPHQLHSFLSYLTTTSCSDLPRSHTAHLALDVSAHGAQGRQQHRTIDEFHALTSTASHTFTMLFRALNPRSAHLFSSAPSLPLSTAKGFSLALTTALCGDDWRWTRFEELQMDFAPWPALAHHFPPTLKRIRLAPLRHAVEAELLVKLAGREGVERIEVECTEARSALVRELMREAVESDKRAREVVVFIGEGEEQEGGGKGAATRRGATAVK